MPEKFYRVETPNACFGICTNGGFIIRGASIAHWWFGKTLKEYEQYLIRKFHRNISIDELKIYYKI